MTFRQFVLYLLGLCFPAGVWCGFEGYELPGLLLLILGWMPVAMFFALHYDEGRK